VIQIAAVVTMVSPLRLHGFGFKIDALAATASRLISADSLSWSLDARYNDPLPGTSGATTAASTPPGGWPRCRWTATAGRLPASDRGIARLGGAAGQGPVP
jgi:hypothetical protein